MLSLRVIGFDGREKHVTYLVVRDSQFFASVG